MNKTKKINHCAVFKPRTKNEDNAELTNSIIISARKTGQLNLSSRGLFSGICDSERMIDLANRFQMITYNFDR